MTPVPEVTQEQQRDSSSAPGIPPVQQRAQPTPKPKHNFKEHGIPMKLSSVKGNWRVHATATLPYTIINQTFTYKDLNGKETLKIVPHLSPLGMVKSFSEILCHPKCKKIYSSS